MKSPSRFRTGVVLVLAILANGAGNLGLSYGMKAVGAPRSWTPGALGEFLGDAMSSPAVLAGSLLLLLFFALFLTLLSWADLSYVLPMVSSCFVVSALLGRVVLGEAITPARWAGILLVTAGIALVGRTGPDGR